MEHLVDIKLRTSSDYQRDNFDSFLKKIHFKYTVPSIHISGTNGKGSTATYLANIYKEGGYKVGLFTSPSFYQINESILINNEPISDDDLLKIVNDNKKIIEKHNLSSFEVLVYVAFTYFMIKKCDIAIIECGMGGELDATNIFTPVLSIITSISLEHTSFLGKSLTEIALHKGGIIKYQIPVLIGDFLEEAKNTLLDIAKDLESKVYSIAPCSNIRFDNQHLLFDYGRLKDIRLNTFVEYETINARYAIEGVEILSNIFPIKDQDLYKALENTFIPCRGEIVNQNPLVILDGAHNPEAMDTFVNSFLKISNNKQIYVIFASFADKNLIQTLSSIGQLTSNIIFTTFDNPRARVEEDYMLFEEYSFVLDIIKKYEEIKISEPDSIIIFTGSLAFTALVRKLIKG